MINLNLILAILGILGTFPLLIFTLLGQVGLIPRGKTLTVLITTSIVLTLICLMSSIAMLAFTLGSGGFL